MTTIIGMTLIHDTTTIGMITIDHTINKNLG